MKKELFPFKLFLIFILISFQNIFSQITINMEKEGGVYSVPCNVNGLKLRFIFDTGASNVSISLTEALFMLKNGYLDPNDIIGEEKYSDATGKVSVGTIINIRKINFSGLALYNVKASIVNELSAPLLLGQSAMEKLGKFIFDPIKGELTILNNTKPDNKTNHPSSDIQKPESKIGNTALDDRQSKGSFNEKYAGVVASKKAFFDTTKANATTTASGLTYKIIQKVTGVKPVDGSTFYFHYAGYFEDGTLFDSSYEDVNKAYGKYDANRAAQNGYQAFPFQAGKKDGMIPGFLEGLSLMSYGDKALLFIPSNLAYGEKGAGGIIPPNTTLIFELEMFNKPTAPKQ